MLECILAAYRQEVLYRSEKYLSQIIKALLANAFHYDSILQPKIQILYKKLNLWVKSVSITKYKE